MSRSILNKNKYRQFVARCKSSERPEIQVQRGYKKKQVLLRYSVTRLRNGRRANGEWTIPRSNKTEEQIEKEIEEVLQMMRKDFLVRQGSGFRKVETTKSDSEEATNESEVDAPKTE